jgi:hypothetical protein
MLYEEGVLVGPPDDPMRWRISDAHLAEVRAKDPHVGERDRALRRAIREMFQE